MNERLEELLDEEIEMWKEVSDGDFDYSNDLDRSRLLSILTAACESIEGNTEAMIIGGVLQTLAKENLEAAMAMPNEELAKLVENYQKEMNE